MPPSTPSPTPRPAARSLVLGVLGGIASGKSRVAELLAGARGRVIDADRCAAAVLASPAVVERIRAHFGDEAVGPDGRPDRAVLAARVFADPGERRRLEGWIHPPVRDMIFAELAEARSRGASPVVLDVPLLLENDEHHHLVAECDALVFVDSDLADRDRRAVASRGWETGEVARREATQIPLEEKRRRADHVLTNRGSLEELERSARELLRVLVPQSDG